MSTSRRRRRSRRRRPRCPRGKRSMRTGRSGIDDRRRRELTDEVARASSEVDGEPADDERRPHDDRVADPLGERQRLLDAVGHAALGLRDARAGRGARRTASAPRPGRSPRGRCPSSGTPAAASGAARLSGVWPPNATTAGSERSTPIGRLGVDDAPHALRVERLEVQAGRGVEVGRDGLGVRVDHDGAASRLAGARPPPGPRSSRTRCPGRCGPGPSR